MNPKNRECKRDFVFYCCVNKVIERDKQEIRDYHLLVIYIFYGDLPSAVCGDSLS
jgi:hypothetical protein